MSEHARRVGVAILATQVPAHAAGQMSERRPISRKSTNAGPMATTQTSIHVLTNMEIPAPVSKQQNLDLGTATWRPKTWRPLYRRDLNVQKGNLFLTVGNSGSLCIRPCQRMAPAIAAPSATWHAAPQAPARIRQSEHRVSTESAH